MFQNKTYLVQVHYGNCSRSCTILGTHTEGAGGGRHEKEKDIATTD